jgi:hypothetical protein
LRRGRQGLTGNEKALINSSAAPFSNMSISPFLASNTSTLIFIALLLTATNVILLAAGAAPPPRPVSSSNVLAYASVMRLLRSCRSAAAAPEGERSNRGKMSKMAAWSGVGLSTSGRISSPGGWVSTALMMARTWRRRSVDQREGERARRGLSVKTSVRRVSWVKDSVVDVAEGEADEEMFVDDPTTTASPIFSQLSQAERIISLVSTLGALLESSQAERILRKEEVLAWATEGTPEVKEDSRWAR